MKLQTCSTLRASDASSLFFSISVWIFVMLAVFVFSFPNITSTCFRASSNAARPASCWNSQPSLLSNYILISTHQQNDLTYYRTYYFQQRSIYTQEMNSLKKKLKMLNTIFFHLYVRKKNNGKLTSSQCFHASFRINYQDTIKVPNSPFHSKACFQYM